MYKMKKWQVTYISGNRIRLIEVETNHKKCILINATMKLWDEVINTDHWIPVKIKELKEGVI